MGHRSCELYIIVLQYIKLTNILHLPVEPNVEKSENVTKQKKNIPHVSRSRKNGMRLND